MMEWLLHQPDHILDQGEVNRDFLQADFTMLHQKVVTDTVHKDVIQKELTRRLGDFTGHVTEEIDFAFRKAWGVNTKEWTTVTAYDSMSEVISRISNRVLVGLPLCKFCSFHGDITLITQVGMRITCIILQLSLALLFLSPLRSVFFLHF
jgi:hypothetical protein